MIFIKVNSFVCKGEKMPVILKLQILRHGTKYASYRVTLPKDIIEAKGWEKSKFRLELKEDKMILKAIKNS